MKVNTYLNFGGNCAEAFQFYADNIGATIYGMMKQSQMPGSQVPPERANDVLHARITIGDTQIMASDVPPERFQPIRSVYLALRVDSDAEAERIFAILGEGGEVYMPMQETFFASRYVQFRDRFGVSWMILHEKPMGPPQA
jgi:PhnB protein